MAAGRRWNVGNAAVVVVESKKSGGCARRGSSVVTPRLQGSSFQLRRKVSVIKNFADFSWDSPFSWLQHPRTRASGAAAGNSKYVVSFVVSKMMVAHVRILKTTWCCRSSIAGPKVT